MENDIWNEISSFLNQLRCENINRESYIYFQELANIQLKKKMEKEKVNKLLDHISYEDREKLKQYGEILEEEAFVSEQRAYCQGYVDCIQLLAGLGLLKKSTDLKQFWKNGKLMRRTADADQKSSGTGIIFVVLHMEIQGVKVFIRNTIKTC